MPEELAAKGVKLNTYELPVEERQRWVEKGAVPVWESWKKTTESKGFSETDAVLEFILHPAR